MSHKKKDLEAIYDAKAFLIKEEVNESDDKLLPQCRGLQFSEILSYYDTARTEQFIEIYNSGSEQVLVDGCELKYKNKSYPKSNLTV